MFDFIYTKVLRPLFFLIDGEKSHDIVITALSLFPWCIRLRKCEKKVVVDGLEFRNPVMIAAGLVKNAEALYGLARLGVGAIEVGTVTPQRQVGNPKPRLFRDKKGCSLLNHMGFNNQGFLLVKERILQHRTKVAELGVKIGVNIGKQASTELDKAHIDYCKGIDFFYDCADYLVVNLSSPNTPDLTNLQIGNKMQDLLTKICSHWQEAQKRHNRKVPLMVKISPNLTPDNLLTIGRFCADKFSAIIATNTIPTKKGGISGLPLRLPSRNTLSFLKKSIPDLSVISAGGIMTSKEAMQRLAMGAVMVQLYSGLIFSGTNLINSTLDSLEC